MNTGEMHEKYMQRNEVKMQRNACRGMQECNMYA
jgi:hypothetical protein